jgi:hypothetical protein
LQHVATDHRSRLRAERPGRLDVRLLAHADHVVTHDAEVLRDVDDRDRNRRGEHALAELVREQEGDDDREQQIGEGEKRIHDQH